MAPVHRPNTLLSPRTGGEASNVLQEVRLPIVGIRECQSKYESAPSFPRQFPGGFGDSKLCAAEKAGGKDACQVRKRDVIIICKLERMIAIV